MSLPLKEPCIRSLRHVGLKSSLFTTQSKIAITQGNHYTKQTLCSNVSKTLEDTCVLGIRPTSSFYMNAITAYGHAKNKDKLIATWEDYRRHYKLKSSSHHRYIKALVECGDISTAYQILRDLKTKHYVKHEEISRCLAEFVSACLERNHMYLALKTTSDYLNFADAWDKDALQQVVQSLWDAYAYHLPIDKKKMNKAEFDKFVALYRERMTVTHRTKSKDHFMPSHLFTMFKLITATHPWIPSAHACNLVLDSQLIGANYGAIKFVLAYMQKHSIQPTTHTVSVLLKALGSSLPGNEIQSLYNNLKKNNRVDVNIYQAFIKVFSEKSDTVHAQAVALDMKNEGLPLEQNTCIAIVEGFVNKEDLDQAANWLKQNEDMALNNLDAYAVLMEAWIARGKWDACMDSYAWLESKCVKEITTNRRIVKALLTARFASGKHWSHCESQLKNLSITFTPTTLFRILRTLLGIEKNGHYLVSGKSIAKALQMMEKELDVHLNSEGISRIIVALGKRGDYKQGFTIYNWVREDKSCVRARCSSSNIYRAIMYSALLNNDFRMLERAWIDMQYRKWFIECENGTKSDKIGHTLARYNMLLNGYASLLPRPDITRLKKTYQRLLKQQLSPDITTYNILIKAFVNGDNMKAANQVYRNMIDSGINPDTITANTLLNGWILRKEWAEVEKFVQKLKSTNEGKQNHGLDIVTFNLLVQSFLHLDSKSMAFSRLLKSQRKWRDALELENSRVKLSSNKIWKLFETTTGYSKETLDNYYKNSNCDDHPAASTEQSNLDCDMVHDYFVKLMDSRQQQVVNFKDTNDAFIRFFSKSTEPDQVTYKLFMKAFVNRGDFCSAFKIKQWMDFRLPSMK
ncbi:hypothetical protein G6F46_002865 [Rhizopus delemar]|uniref:Pentacotripeptide-repeat region of PRORP domain-containing protein n=2 Tax=Rhizopus TaxID=4842 RepID=A0A9P7CS26_9FUNG|nr:hypothetical protein G6F43_004054 [Rhizopus delemar]KAG1551292.1 hypothetical protein G6F51_001931 [Rhizopus arrhizus]KAG1466848.1 hypothetical protein G6F55_000209 [Rhizopus delemar]KAG1503378.1 hypothetical protein G6F54_001711 [Rhizopus delemar]KAG1516048.1 hypothetical protein G6F53_002449 [Rhizopus delemar]